MKYTLLYSLLISFSSSLYAQLIDNETKSENSTVVLYNKTITSEGDYSELLTEGANAQFTQEGLRINGNDGLVKLNYYYSLSERLIRYHVQFSNDTKAVFQSDKGDFKVFVDVPNKSISIETDPQTVKVVDFIDYKHDYIIEIHRTYQVAKVRIIDLFTGESTEIEATMDGSGGHGAGVVNKGFFVGQQHDYYCVGLSSGSALLVKQISVLAQESDLTLLLYGDSITEPEGYFPTVYYPQSWTQLIMGNIKGKSISSGRGGTTIVELMERIKNELPYVKAKYVMVTIGTNGGNTEENLSELVEYIVSQGSIPILNNIPSNESGSQVPINIQIEKVRQKYGIKGCKFDLATSLNHEGKQVDNTTMWFEDYDWGKIYHHPNVKGSLQMYTRTLIDVPEIYE